MDENVKISVLMTVYNGEKYLREAINSVLSQTFTDFEFIIVNDGSKDNSLEIIKSYKDPRIVFIDNQVNSGLIKSLNIGISNAKGKYIARMDQDDISLPNRFATQYDFMEKNPNIDVVGGWTECVNPSGNSIKISRNVIDPWVIRYEFLFNNVMFHSSIFFKTEVIKKNGGYSEQFVHSEDYEMYSRPGKELLCANIPQVLFKLRLHNESITGSDTTQPTVHKNALNVAFRNISQYIIISRPDFDLIKDIMIIKKPSQNTSLATLWKAGKILKKATESFIKKNKLDKTNADLVMKSYRGRRKMMWQHYIIGKYHKYFKIND
ncbi:MAG TPA: glycosyltransferase [Candidatus Paceibacterota bacterium]